MKKVVSALAVAAALVLAAVALAGTYGVSATLKPGNDVPKPKGAPNAKGTFSGKYVEHKGGATLTWKLSYSGLTGPALQAHIHAGKRGVSGNVIVPLCAPCPSGMKGTAKISESVIKVLEAGGAYVNVHTKKNPAGEIRGQIKVSG